MLFAVFTSCCDTAPLPLSPTKFAGTPFGNSEAKVLVIAGAPPKFELLASHTAFRCWVVRKVVPLLSLR